MLDTQRDFLEPAPLHGPCEPAPATGPEPVSCSVRFVQEPPPQRSCHEVLDNGRLCLSMGGRDRPQVRFELRILEDGTHVLELEHLTGGGSLMCLMTGARPYLVLCLEGMMPTGLDISSHGGSIQVDGLQCWDTESAARCLLDSPTLSRIPTEFLAALDLLTLSSVFAKGRLVWPAGSRRAMRDLYTRALVNRLRSEATPVN